MDSLRPQHVSVIDPIGPAIEHVRRMLFRPFDLSKWIIIGFCAWLAQLGQGGGPNFNFNFPFDNQHRDGPQMPDISEVKEAIMPYLPFIIAGACMLVVLSIIIGLVLCWLRSRGQFMFVHCVAGNKAEVVVPWNKFSRHGNSLFVFKLVLGLITLAIMAIPIVVLVVAIIAVANGKTGIGVAGIVSSVSLIFVISIIAALITKFVDDFVVPIMALHTASSLAGFKMLLALIGCNKARMALYILFQIVISMVIGVIAFSICLLGCCLCCSCALLFIPYIGTVILLPLFAFKRAYSLYYLRQFGPQFDVFGVGQC